MARKVEFKLTIDGRRVSRSTKRLKKDVQGLDKQTKSLTGSVGGLQRGFKKFAGFVGTLALGQVIARQFRYAIEVGTQFEQQLADLEAITGITGEALDFLGQRARDTAEQYGEASDNIIEAQKLVASQLAEKIDFGTQAGVEQLAEIADEAVLLSKAAGTELEPAVQAVSTAINQFNLPASEANRIVNAIAAGAKFGAAELMDQGKAFIDSGTAASQANISFEELNAAIQVLAANGIKAGRAGTSLRNIIIRLQTRSDELAKEGITNLNIQSDGLAGTLQKLEPIMDDTQAMNRIFGDEAQLVASILATQSDAITSLTDKVTGTNVAMDQAAIQMQTVQGAASRLREVYKNELIEAFNETNGAMVQMIELTIEVTKGFASGVDGINRYAREFSDLSEQVGFARAAFAEMADISFAASSLEWFGELFGILDDTDAVEEWIDQIKGGTDQVREWTTSIMNLVDFHREARSETEKGSEEYQRQNRIIDKYLDELKEMKALGADRLEQLEDERNRVDEDSEAYAKLTFQIRQQHRRMDIVNQAIEDGNVARHGSAEAAREAAQAEKEAGDASQTYSEQIKTLEESIGDILDKTGELTEKEINLVNSYKAQIRTLETLKRLRREAAEEGGAGGRPSAPMPDRPDDDIIAPEDIEFDDAGFSDEFFEKMDLAEAVFEEIDKKVKKTSVTMSMFGDRNDELGQEVALLEGKIRQLIDDGYTEEDEALRQLISRHKELSAEMERRNELISLGVNISKAFGNSILSINEINKGMKENIQLIRRRAEADKAEAETSAERMRIEKRAQKEVQQAKEQASEARREAIKDNIKAVATEAAVTQFAKVISTLPFPFNIIAAPAAAAAVRLGIDKLVDAAFLEGGVVSGATGGSGLTSRGKKIISINEDDRPEFIVNAETTRRALPLLEALNNNPSLAEALSRGRGFQQGGMVGIGDAVRSGMQGASIRVVLSIAEVDEKLVDYREFQGRIGN